MAPYIVDSETDIITIHPELRLASNNVNVKALEHFLFEAIQMLKENSALFLISILKTSVGAIEDRRIFWGKTSADLENNIEYDE